MKILVSLINYNSRDHILACLQNIYDQKTKYDFDVVVFDNNSPDQSAGEIKKQYPKIHLIRNDKNLGFGKAHNRVAKEFQGKFDVLLLVNPDTRFENNTFEELGNYMENERYCDILSTKIVDFDGKPDSNGGDFPRGLALLGWLYNLESFGIKRNFHRTDKEYYTKPHSVDWVGGTFLLIRNQVIEKIGLFDEEFFMYFEDAEFCYRARRAGFNVMINPLIVVSHASGASTNNPKYFQWSNEYKNLLHFYKKTFGKLWAFWVRILVYAALLLRLIAFGLLGRLSVVKTYWKVLVSI